MNNNHQSRRPGRTSEGTQGLLSRVLRWISVGFCVLFLLIATIRIYEYYKLVQVKHQMEQEIQQLRQENTRLEEEKARLQDPKEIEKVARKELGMVKPGEVPYLK